MANASADMANKASSTMANAEFSEPDVANVVSTTYRYRNREWRKEYQRRLMQLRRALGSGRAEAWPKVKSAA